MLGISSLPQLVFEVTVAFFSAKLVVSFMRFLIEYMLYKFFNADTDLNHPDSKE